MSEKRIKEFAAKKELKSEAINQLDEKLNERKKHLKAKKDELDEILNETELEETLLAKKAMEYQVKIEPSLFDAYHEMSSLVEAEKLLSSLLNLCLRPELITYQPARQPKRTRSPGPCRD